MASNKQIIAYFPNWGTYNVNHQNMTVGMIPWKKVTMVYHAFYEIGPDWKLKSTDDWADYQKPYEHSEAGWDSNVLKGHIGEYKYYKGVYPNKKLVLSIGGYTKSANFPEMSENPDKRSVFIQSCIDFLKKYPFFDGLDIDWEYPQARSKLTFTIFLKELRQAYNNNGLSNKIITIAAPLGYQNIQYQDTANYIQYLDLVNIMAYDVYGAWGNLTNHHSPLYNNPLNPDSDALKFNIDYAVQAYMNGGVPKEKLCIGTPYYSRGWANVNFASAKGPNGLFATASGAPVGTWDESWAPGGQWPWFQVKEFESNPSWEKYYDEITKAPYLINRSQKYFLTYEDERSLKDKINYILNKDLAGIIIWEITGDDLRQGLAPMTTILWDNLVEIQGGQMPDAPPIRATGVVDKPINLDGVYLVTFTIGAQNTATSFEVYENDTKVKIGLLSPNQDIKQDVMYQASGKAPGTYNYKMILKNQNSQVESNPVIVVVQAVQPPTSVPTAPMLQLDNPTNTGIYQLNILLPPNNNATGLKIYENTVVIQDVPVENKFTQQTYTAKFNDKKTGTYVYKARLYNGNGGTDSQDVTVNVNNPQQPGSANIPTAPQIRHDNWLNGPNYKIYSDMWWGVNATSVSLYENNVLVETKALADNSPNAQHAEWSISGKQNGSYSYYVEAGNINGKVKSDALIVSVTKGIGGVVPKPLKPEISVDNVKNAGKYQLTGKFPANSSANQYTLYENNSAVATGLLTPNKSTADNVIVKSYVTKTNGVYTYRIDVTNGTEIISSDNLAVTVSETSVPPVQVEANMTFAVTSDWGSGANFSITIHNNTNSSIDRWSLEFDFDKAIGYVWDTVMTVSGNHYTFTNPSWGGPIPANGNFTFGGGCDGNVGTLKPRTIRLNGKNVELV